MKDAAGHVRLVLHVHDRSATGRRDTTDARRAAEGDVAQVVDGEGVDLSYLRALDVHQDRAVVEHLLDAVAHQ